MVINATTNAYKNLKTDLGIDPSNGLDKWIYYSNLQNADGPLFLYNIKNIFVKKWMHA